MDPHPPSYRYLAPFKFVLSIPGVSALAMRAVVQPDSFMVEDVVLVIVVFNVVDMSVALIGGTYVSKHSCM